MDPVELYVMALLSLVSVPNERECTKTECKELNKEEKVCRVK